MKFETNIKCIVVEDDEILRKGLKQMLQLYAPHFEVIAEADTVNLAVEQLVNLQPDVVFLDIMLIGGTGFDVLEEYKKEKGKPDFHLVFITAFEEFAIKAFRMSALDYLLKPIDPDELKEVITKIGKSKSPHQQGLDLLAEQLDKQNGSKKIALSTAEGIYIVVLSDLIYAQANNNYTTFFLRKQKQILVSKPLKEYDELLKDKGFLRVHQSYLVQIEEIQFYNKSDQTLVLTTGDVIPVASRKKEWVLKVLGSMTQ
jgi:two-component system LytT family response regulator